MYASPGLERVQVRSRLPCEGQWRIEGCLLVRVTGGHGVIGSANGGGLPGRAAKCGRRDGKTGAEASPLSRPDSTQLRPEGRNEGDDDVDSDPGP